MVSGNHLKKGAKNEKKYYINEPAPWGSNYIESEKYANEAIKSFKIDNDLRTADYQMKMIASSMKVQTNSYKTLLTICFSFSCLIILLLVGLKIKTKNNHKYHVKNWLKAHKYRLNCLLNEI